jgi:hypothetical protein
MHKNSLYTKILNDLEERISMGYDYGKGGLLRKFLSPMMFLNPRLNLFLTKIDPLMIEMAESVKKIQFYFNYTIDKNDRRFNL